MNPDRKAVLAPEDERLLVAQLAEAVLAQAAPEELVIFDEMAEEYSQDPEGGGGGWRTIRPPLTGAPCSTSPGGTLTLLSSTD